MKIIVCVKQVPAGGSEEHTWAAGTEQEAEKFREMRWERTTCGTARSASKSFSGLFGVKPSKMLGRSTATTLRFLTIFHSKIPRKSFSPQIVRSLCATELVNAPENAARRGECVYGSMRQGGIIAEPGR
jgi:hypothetical protein